MDIETMQQTEGVDAEPIGVPSLEGMAGEAHEAATNQMDASSETLAREPSDIDRLRSTYDQRVAAQQKALEIAVAQQQEALRRAQELEQQVFELKIQSLPPYEQEAARERFQLQQQEQALRVAAFHMALERQQYEKMAKIEVVRRLSEQYDVPRERLMKFNDPNAMEAFAQEYANLRKEDRLQERRASGADRVEGRSGRAVPPFNVEAYRDSGDLVGAIRAMRRAGAL